MGIEKALQKIREEIEADDAVREKALPLARKAVRSFSQSIKETHRGNYDQAREHIDTGYQLINQAKEIMNTSEFLARSRILDTAYQELAEALTVYSILREGKLRKIEDYEIPSRSYLTGLADTIGELRRGLLDALRGDEIQKAEKFLHFMEDLLEDLHGFDFPNALIPDLRRKCDVGRGIVERSRGDLTTAVRQARLVDELKRIEQEVAKGED